MIKLLSLFSGIGAFESALRRGYQFETVNYCEIDPYASKAYSQIHGISEDFNLHDVRTVNPLLMNNVNLVTYGFPCQDISVAGKQKGFEHDGERTRSGLFFEALRIIEFLQPEYAICENVKALTSKKFTAEFQTVLSGLSEAGYNNYWKVLNAKDYGIPQNRERVFIVSIRKDIDTGTFTFPEKQELKLRVKDLLEPVVDEKYYLKSQKADDLIRQILAKTDTNLQETDIKVNNIGTYNNHQSGIVNDSNGLSRCLTAVDYKDPVKIIEKIKWCGSVNGHQSGAVIHEDGCCCCLNVAGHVEPQKIMVSNPKIKRLGNLYDENAGGARAGNVYAPNGLAPALQTAQGGNRQPLMYENYRIRKLTPKECFRLMGFTDADFDKIKGISNTQLYKMAGNSICVPVLEAIFRNLFRKE